MKEGIKNEGAVRGSKERGRNQKTENNEWKVTGSGKMEVQTERKRVLQERSRDTWKEKQKNEIKEEVNYTSASLQGAARVLQSSSYFYKNTKLRLSDECDHVC